MKNDTEDSAYLKSLTILYVEDEEDAFDQFREFLSRKARAVVTARNGEEGLHAFQEHRPDIIVTDIQMPVMDGLAMVSAIREMDRSVPIIVLTAFDDTDHMMQSINIDVDRYVTKPVDVSKLQDALHACAHRLLVEQQLKQALAALEIKQQRLVNVIEGTRAGTWEWNVQTGETIFNERWAEMIGYTRDEISSFSFQTIIDFTHPDDLKNKRELLEQHVRGESEYFECESRMKHKNGEWVWVFTCGKVTTRTEDGEPLWMFGTFHEISERKRTEEAIIRAKKEWERTFDAVSDLISIVDANHIIMRVNRAMACRFGLTPQEMIGRKCHEVMHCTSDPIAGCPFEKVMMTKQEQSKIVEETRLNTVFDISVSPMYESGGYLNQCVHIVRDVTEQKQLEEKILKE